MSGGAVQQGVYIELSAEQTQLLKQLAARYIWWKTPDEALRYPGRILANADLLRGGRPEYAVY